MKIQFDILNQEINLDYVFKDERILRWWYRNALPQIPTETKKEDLTESQKISLVKLAIYEGHLDSEQLCNLSHNSFKINN
jgi:hypothetical protein